MASSGSVAELIVGNAIERDRTLGVTRRRSFGGISGQTPLVASSTSGCCAESFAGFENESFAWRWTRVEAGRPRINRLRRLWLGNGQRLVRLRVCETRGFGYLQGADFSAQAQVPTTPCGSSLVRPTVLCFQAAKTRLRASTSVLGRCPRIQRAIAVWRLRTGLRPGHRRSSAWCHRLGRVSAARRLVATSALRWLAMQSINPSSTSCSPHRARSSLLPMCNTPTGLKRSQVDAEGPLFSACFGLRTRGGRCGPSRARAPSFNPTAPDGASYDASRDVEYVFGGSGPPLAALQHASFFSTLGLELGRVDEHYDGFGVHDQSEDRNRVYRPSADWTLQGTWGTSCRGAGTGPAVSFRHRDSSDSCQIPRP